MLPEPKLRKSISDLVGTLEDEAPDGKCAGCSGGRTMSRGIENSYVNHSKTDMKILRIDSSILGASSITRDLTAAIMDAMRTRSANLEIEYLDLVEDPISHMDGAVAAGFRPNVTAEFDAAALHQKEISDRLRNSYPRQNRGWPDRPVHRRDVASEARVDEPGCSHLHIRVPIPETWCRNQADHWTRAAQVAR